MRNSKYMPVLKHEEAKYYHDMYDKYRIASPIINNAANQPGVNMIFWDRSTIGYELERRRGDSKGFFMKDGESYLALIPSLQEEFDTLHNRFDSYCQDQVNRGRKKPKEWPKNLLEMKYRIEARHDVTLEEIAMLEKKLQKFIEEDRKESDKKILLHGPKGNTQINNGKVSFIDFQKVTFTEDEEPVPYIDCARSPYDGMSLQDYFKYIVEEWKIARINQQLLNQRELDRRGISLADRPLGKRKATNVPWPERPENITNHKIIKENVETN